MARFLRFLAWTAGTLVVLAAVAIGAVYFYVTSDDFRGRVESHASTLSGRKTTIADISVAGDRHRQGTWRAGRSPSSCSGDSGRWRCRTRIG